MEDRATEWSYGSIPNGFRSAPRTLVPFHLTALDGHRIAILKIAVTLGLNRVEEDWTYKAPGRLVCDPEPGW